MQAEMLLWANNVCGGVGMQVTYKEIAITGLLTCAGVGYRDRI